MKAVMFAVYADTTNSRNNHQVPVKTVQAVDLKHIATCWNAAIDIEYRLYTLSAYYTEVDTVTQICRLLSFRNEVTIDLFMLPSSDSQFDSASTFLLNLT